MYWSYFTRDGGLFITGLYRREAKAKDRSSSKRFKQDPRAKEGFGTLDGVNFSNFICLTRHTGCRDSNIWTSVPGWRTTRCQLSSAAGADAMGAAVAVAHKGIVESAITWSSETSNLANLDAAQVVLWLASIYTREIPPSCLSFGALLSSSSARHRYFCPEAQINSE